jgi:crotonobetainyl-CoA:carnitine CoA-transferase CaiB-like acyl-CoA transferase
VRRENCTALVETLDAIFGAQPMRHWAEAFDRAGMWWAPLQTVSEVVDDPQARAGGAFVPTPVADGEAEMAASPMDFAATPWKPAGMAPEHGQHTEEILLELGYDWEKIAALRDRGAIA